ncbi:MAG: helix-turn-helix domain-containing protein [Thermoflexales bacterium]
MRHPLRIARVHGRTKARLESLYREARCPRFRIRVQMVLLSIQGKTIQEIASTVRQSRETVRRWLRRFLEEGVNGLTEHDHPGRPPIITEEIECYLLECIEQQPREYGKDRATWTTALLAEEVKTRYGVQVTDECIRQHLGEIEVVSRRPTWSVKHIAVQQPGYAQKKRQLQGSWRIHPVVPMSTSRMKPR